MLAFTALASFMVLLDALYIVNDKQVKWLQVQVHDAFRVDLVQAQQKISRNDLDVTKVESLATLDKVLK